MPLSLTQDLDWMDTIPTDGIPPNSAALNIASSARWGWLVREEAMCFGGPGKWSFALNIARFQQGIGAPITGVVDLPTLTAMHNTLVAWRAAGKPDGPGAVIAECIRMPPTDAWKKEAANASLPVAPGSSSDGPGIGVFAAVLVLGAIGAALYVSRPKGTSGRPAYA